MLDFVSPRVVYGITQKFPGTSLKMQKFWTCFISTGTEPAFEKQYLVESLAQWKSLLEEIIQLRMQRDLRGKK